MISKRFINNDGTLKIADGASNIVYLCKSSDDDFSGYLCGECANTAKDDKGVLGYKTHIPAFGLCPPHWGQLYVCAVCAKELTIYDEEAIAEARIKSEKSRLELVELGLLEDTGPDY